MKTALAALLLVLVAGCGGGDGGSDGTVVVSGKVHVDSVTRVRSVVSSGNATHQCYADELAGKKVVITNSDGKKVGLFALASIGVDDPMPQNTEDYFGGVPGTCNFEFSATVPESDGVYTASIEGVEGAEASFTEVDATAVLIELS